MARIDLRDNEYMERFVGQDHIDSNDVQFWYQLLSCSFNFMRVQDPKVVDKTLEPYLVRLTLNNSSSFNVGSLIRVFLDRVSRIKSPSGQSTNPYYVFQTFNALYLIRSICKSYIETLNEEQLIKSLRAKVDVVASTNQTIPSQPPVPPPQLQSPPKAVQSQQQPSPNTSSVDTNLQNAPQQNQDQVIGGAEPNQKNDAGSQVEQKPTIPTFDVVANIASASMPATNVTTKVVPQVDTTTTIPQDTNKKAEFTPGSSMLDQLVSTLIAIIVDIPLIDSTYLLQVESMNALLVLLSVQMYSNTPANQSVIYKCLMQKKCSIHALILTKTLLNNFVNQQPVPQEAGSIIIGLASGLWKVLTLGYGSQAEEEDSENMPLLAKQSLLLLNILTNHYTSEKNPYREAIVSCQDSRYNLSDPQTALANANNDALATASTSKSVLMSNSVKIDFHKLYETICKYLHNDQVALLLYLLLHRNKIFRPYILTTASSELDRLLLPLLKILYTAIERGSHHVYMVLIIFIILSEEASFNEVIHKITVRGVPWYKDRILNEISLGSLTALIIIRSLQYNTFRIKDKFLHTNLFATLANLSNYFHNLHPYVCQRIVDLLERLSKRYLAATKPARELELPAAAGNTLDVLDSNNPLAKALATDTHKHDLQDASSIEIDSTNTGQMQVQQPQQSIQTDQVGISMPGGNETGSQNQNQRSENLVLPPIDMQTAANSNNEISSHQSLASNSESNSEHINISMDDSRQDISLIEEVIRMLLEVINSSLATQLNNNPDLIYTLLYKRQVFGSLLSSHQSFYNMVINVERILTFFYNKIETFERQLSVEEIKALIQETSKNWNYDQGRDSNAKLLFHYVEDEKPEEFFIPYIWTRIYYSSGIVWNSKRIVLFNPDDL